MGILNRANFRRHTKTLRSLDYENMPSSVMRDGTTDSGRISDELYEGTRRVPSRDLDGDDAAAEPTAHHPVQGERPSSRAQWDDVRGVWVEWSDDAGDWVPVEGAS